MNNPIKFIVVQAGHCVFGAGSTLAEAIADSVEWIDGVNTPAEVEVMLSDSPNDGDMAAIDSDNPEFAEYLRSHGGFSEINGQWFAD